jgi:uncharacterized protein YfaS (alpha-2-macroglobulin family)
VGPVHCEFRRDRITAAFDRSHHSAPVVTVGYVLRSGGPCLPQAKLEDLYGGDRFARTGIERSR